MARLTVRFGGGKVFDRIPRDAQARLNAAMLVAINNATRFGHTLAVAFINKRTGRTATTVDSSVTGGGSTATGRWGSDDKVATILEFGSRPHRIPGAFGIPKGVWHPGTQPYLWLTRSGPPAGNMAKIELAAAFRSVFG